MPGIICFTFDDRNFSGWLAALPLFRKYQAHVSFFISGVIDAEALSVMKKLSAEGHTVGLHTLHHADAPEYFAKHGAQAYFDQEIAPQLEPAQAAGLSIHSFGYPNNYHSDETDAFLGKTFRHFRVGLQGFSPFIALDALPQTRVMHSAGIGVYYHTVLAELLQTLEQAARTNTLVSFFSHNIAPDADFIDMPTATLEACLQTARRCGIALKGFDDLP